MKKILLFYSAVLVFCSLVFLWPLYREGFIATDDGDWMIIRLSAFYQSLREGQFPVRLLGRLNVSYGYPVANFLYPGFMYIGSVIHAAGVPFIETVKIIFSGSVIIAVLAVFFWLVKFVNPLRSFFAALSFLLSPYVAFDVFRRGSLGEVLAIACTAVSLYAIEAQKRHITTISLSLLLLAHNSVAFLSFPFLFFYGLMRRRWYVVFSSFLALGITAFFWVPALVERELVQFNLIQVSNPYEYFAVNSQWFLHSLPHLFALAAAVLLWKKLTVLLKLFLFGYVGVLFISLPLSSTIWSFEEFAQLFQFPYRFLSVGLFIGTMLFAGVLQMLPTKAAQIVAGCLLVMLIPSLMRTYQGIVRTYQPETFYTTNEATTTVAGEYLPRWVREPPTERNYQEIEFYQGRGNITIQETTTHKVVASVKTEENSVLQINSIYYPGWGVLVNGVPVDLDYDNPRGLIRFSVPKGEYTISGEFRETVFRFVTNIISIMSGLVFLVAVIVPYTTKKRVYDLCCSIMRDGPEQKVNKRQ